MKLMTKAEKIGVAAAVVVVAALLGGNLAWGVFAPVAGELGTSAEGDDEVPSLIVETVQKGEGDTVKAGDVISVHYVGRFEDGQIFDSSRSRGEPFIFTLGGGQVITGWDIGLQGMQVGGVRKLTIPSGLAYGETGRGPIPPNATLVFEVELVGIESSQ